MLTPGQLSGEWRSYLSFIEQMRKEYGKGLDPEECQSEAFAAIVEAKSTYLHYAGCYPQDDHLFLSVRNAMTSMRKKQNEVLILESALSLDGQAPGGGHAVGDYFLPKERRGELWCGLEADAIARDFQKELTPMEREVLRGKGQGYGDKEIARKLKLSRQEFRAMERSLRVKAKAYFENPSPRSPSF